MSLNFSALANQEFKYFELTDSYKTSLKKKTKKLKDPETSPLLSKAWKLIKTEGLRQANKLTADILDFNKNFPLGKYSVPGLDWSSGVAGGFGIDVGRRVEPTLDPNGPKWQVYDELSINLSAFAYLSEQRDLGKIKISDKNLGLYTGVFYTRRYNYIHYANSYREGLTKKFDKLFLSFNYFREANFLAIAPNEVISKTDLMTAKIGFALQTPSVYFISGYGRGTIYSSKLSTLTYHKDHLGRNLNVTKLVARPKGTNIQIGLQADFFGLLTLSLLGGEYRLDITKSTISNMSLNPSKIQAIKRDPAMALAFRRLNKGMDPMKSNTLLPLISSVEEGNRITEEMRLFFLKWGKHKGSFTEDIVLSRNGNRFYFYRHGQENVALNKSWWDSFFNARKVNKYKSRAISNMSLEYQAMNPKTPFENIHLNKEALISYRISKQFHAKKNKYAYRNEAVNLMKDFAGIDSKIVNGLRNSTLRAPLLVDIDAQISTNGINYLLNLSPSQLVVAFGKVCSGLNNCTKQLAAKMKPLYHEYQTRKTINISQLKDLLQSITHYTTKLHALKELFGRFNVQVSGTLQASTSTAGKSFKIYVTDGFGQGNGIIKDFIERKKK